MTWVGSISPLSRKVKDLSLLNQEEKETKAIAPDSKVVAVEADLHSNASVIIAKAKRN